MQENTRVAKKSNMADDSDNKSDTTYSKEEEPGLHEIKSMLVNIQATVATIVEETKNFRKGLANLKRAVHFNDNDRSKTAKEGPPEDISDEYNAEEGTQEDKRRTQ